jgi:ABC-type multidrug transport system fused ATPase/permease subunit
MNADQPAQKSRQRCRGARHLRPHRWRPAGSLAPLLGISLCLLKPLPLAVILDTILGQRPLHPILAPWLDGFATTPLLAVAAAAIVVITIAIGAATVGSNYLTIDVGQRMVNDLRNALYVHRQKLSLKFHNKQQTGDLLFRVMADTFSIRDGDERPAAGPLNLMLVAVRGDVPLRLAPGAGGPLVCPLCFTITRLAPGSPVG